jgi:hypothetical protein
MRKAAPGSISETRFCSQKPSKTKRTGPEERADALLGSIAGSMAAGLFGERRLGP